MRKRGLISNAYIYSQERSLNVDSVDSDFRSGLVSQFIESGQKMYRKNLHGHYGCVNAVEFSNNGGKYIASGGDDLRILLWELESAVWGGGTGPRVMKTTHLSNIFCLSFNCDNSQIYSGGNDYQVKSHNLSTGELEVSLPHEDVVWGVAGDPINPSIMATACQDGRVLLYDLRTPTHECTTIAETDDSMHSLAFNPIISNIIASSNATHGIQLWDTRSPLKPFQSYQDELDCLDDYSMGVCFSSDGRKMAFLKRRGGVCLTPMNSQQPLPQDKPCTCHLNKIHDDVTTENCGNQPNNDCFHRKYNGMKKDIKHWMSAPIPSPLSSPLQSVKQTLLKDPGFFNLCTMKSCTFAGENDEYLVSGSDDFKLYLWKVPEEGTEIAHVARADYIFNGHRSIPNHVRYNKANCMFMSSGVEKVIKLWSPLWLSTGSVREESERRKQVAPSMRYDLEADDSDGARDESLEEDTRILSFFDFLIHSEVSRRNAQSSDAGSLVGSISVASDDSSSSSSSSRSRIKSSSDSSNSSSSISNSSKVDRSIKSECNGEGSSKRSKKTKGKLNEKRSSSKSTTRYRSLSSSSSSSSDSSKEVKNKRTHRRKIRNKIKKATNKKNDKKLKNKYVAKKDCSKSLRDLCLAYDSEDMEDNKAANSHLGFCDKSHVYDMDTTDDNETVDKLERDEDSDNSSDRCCIDDDIKDHIITSTPVVDKRLSRCEDGECSMVAGSSSKNVNGHEVFHRRNIKRKKISDDEEEEKKSNKKEKNTKNNHERTDFKNRKNGETKNERYKQKRKNKHTSNLSESSKNNTSRKSCISFERFSDEDLFSDDESAKNDDEVKDHKDDDAGNNDGVGSVMKDDVVMDGWEGSKTNGVEENAHQSNNFSTIHHGIHYNNAHTSNVDSSKTNNKNNFLKNTSKPDTKNNELSISPPNDKG